MKPEHRRVLRSVLRISAALLALAAIALAMLVTYAFKSHWFPRIGLPAFDERKAATLSAEQRTAYEQELFSELFHWNMGSRRYPDVPGIYERARRWQQMADEGFELAHITLRVLQIPGGNTYSLARPMRRLEKLAEGGDAGAMCLMVGLVNRAAIDQDWRPYQPTYKRWLEEGARRGHPECLLQLGGRLLRGTEGYERDIARGLELQFAARRLGYRHNVGALILHYRDRGLDDLDNVRRLYCWTSLDDTVVEVGRAPGKALLAELRARKPAGSDHQWDALLHELDRSNYDLSDCIDFGKGL